MTPSAAGAVDPLGPFHGDKEGAAFVFHLLAWFQAVGLIAGPWVISAIASHHAGHPLGNRRWGPATKVLFPDALGFTLLLSYQSIYNRLSQRIRKGGPDLQFLDWVRYSVASLVVSFNTLLIVAIIFSSAS